MRLIVLFRQIVKALWLLPRAPLFTLPYSTFGNAFSASAI